MFPNCNRLYISNKLYFGESNRDHSKKKNESVKKSLEKSKNVLEEKRKIVKRKICIKKRHTRFTKKAMNFVQEQLKTDKKYEANKKFRYPRPVVLRNKKRLPIYYNLRNIK